MNFDQEQAMDQAAFAKQLAEEGFNEILTRTQPPGQFVDTHAHAFGVKALVLSGELTLGVAGKLTTYQVGDMFTLAPGCEHSERYGEQGVSFLVGRKHV
jgi:quercetin dioxygenase-like cupin family protein